MNNKKHLLLAALAALTVLSGCASVPLADEDRDTAAKTFAVAPGKANLYLYRNERFGRAARPDVALDGKPVGQTAAWTYFRLEVTPGKHTLTSKSENDAVLEVEAEAGRNYFVWQEIKMGVLSARTQLHLVDEATGRAALEDCYLIEPKAQP